MTNEAIASRSGVPERKAKLIEEGGLLADAYPIVVVVLAILLIWYAAAIPMNAVLGGPRIAALGGGLGNTLAVSWSLDRPVLPAPHQVLAAFWTSTFTLDPTTPRSLIYHAVVTLSSTVTGFVIGSFAGVALAVAIIHIRSLQKSLMPWIVASQTIPILAIAPMIIVVLGSLGFTGLLPKSIISAYLCFAPVTISMVKGLQSPEVIQLDLMRTYNASASQTLRFLRLPSSLPFLFAALKIAVSVALIGAIVGELPTGAQAGIGARLLTASQYGQILLMWATLFLAALLACGLIAVVDMAEQLTGRLMGARPANGGAS
jgi:NitT/TauT family transport system permease protein